MPTKIVPTLCLCLLFMSSAMAADIQFNGFASIVSGIDLEDDGNPREGYTNDTVDNLQSSKVALQWTANLDKGIRFVGQTVARGDGDDGYKLEYDWAYFDFNVGDSGKLKVGKIRVPLYKYSDYLDVGYAYHWIAPPPIMYSGTFNDVDGVGYQHNFETGALEQSINAVIGRYQSNNIERTTPFDLRNFIVLNWSATMGDHEFNAVYAQADVYFESPSIVGGNDVLVNGDLGQFIGVGYKGTFGNLAVLTEYKVVTVQDSILADEDSGGYVGAAYNMNDYTYHLTYGFGETTAQTYTDPNTQILAYNVAEEGDTSAITIGVRKDIGLSSAIKVDLTSFTEDNYQGTDNITLTPEEQTALILKVAIETMF